MDEEDDFYEDDYEDEPEPVGNLSLCECGFTVEQCASQECPS